MRMMGFLGVAEATKKGFKKPKQYWAILGNFSLDLFKDQPRGNEDMANPLIAIPLDGRN